MTARGLRWAWLSEASATRECAPGACRTRACGGASGGASPAEGSVRRAELPSHTIVVIGRMPDLKGGALLEDVSLEEVVHELLGFLFNHLDMARLAARRAWAMMVGRLDARMVAGFTAADVGLLRRRIMVYLG
jgi:hypothetical protein